ncbi:MAG: LVIVD repeat-containing protein [Gemmatimonadales bacterium]
MTFPVRFSTLVVSAALLGAAACSSSTYTSGSSGSAPAPGAARARTSPDPRVGLRPGLFDAGEAVWNLQVLSKTPPPEAFVGVTNSDLAFKGPYAIQGNYNGIQVWDISNPSQPSLAVGYVCPASQSDVSVYQNLLFVSGEGFGGRLDCGTQGIDTTVSHERLRGIRIFDISDIRNPKYIANVQTCRGSHTHTVLEDPDDKDNVYIYVSGSAPVRPAEELPGCSGAPPDEDPNSALFRIEVIRVPLAHPEQAAIVSHPRIFNDLAPPPRHGETPEDIAARQARVDSVRQAGGFVVTVRGDDIILGSRFVNPRLDSIVKARGDTGAPTGADTAALRAALPGIVEAMIGTPRPRTGPNQCHDITVYPAIGLAGGACGGYGLLLDIRDPVNPVRIGAVSDSNFAYWHSATFNNDGSKILFTDEWGGGGQPKCRATDPKEWGADAIFTLDNREMRFRSYYKLPVPQTSLENCVAHNGSLIPIPGRDVMVQGWYQGGISVFDWTDPANPVEFAFLDRGPVDSGRMRSGGSWSVYWYNGAIVSSEIARGLDIFELAPSAFLSRNEIDAARTVRLDHLNAQGQPRFVWPATFALARAYVDQLERSNGLSAARIQAVRQRLTAAEGASGAARREALTTLASELAGEAGGSRDAAKVRRLADSVRELAAAT